MPRIRNDHSAPLTPEPVNPVTQNSVHQRHPRLEPTRPIGVHLFGAGGTGARLLYALAGLDGALRALGWAGLEVSVIDPDIVSASNAVRGPFYAGDIGRYKVHALTYRLNLTLGLDWRGYLGLDTELLAMPQIVVACVDTRAARADIVRRQQQTTAIYHLDCGNEARSGQVLLGRAQHKIGRTEMHDLPYLPDHYPALFDAALDVPSAPSCSAAEALAHQDATINDAIASAAATLLWNLLRWGELRYRAAWINLEHGATATEPFQPSATGTDHGRVQ